MKVLHFLIGVQLKDGGVARAVLDNCRVLAEQGHHVVLATKDDTDVPGDWPRAAGFDDAQGRPVVVRLRERGPATAVGRIRTQLGHGDLATMESLIRDADVLHVHGPWEPDNTRLARMARSARTPYVLTPHGMLDDWSMGQRSLKKRIAMKAYASQTLREASIVQCTASAEVDQARKWIGHDRIRIIPYIMDLSPYTALPSRDDARRMIDEPDDGVPLILFLSRIHYKKQPEVLIRALHLLAQQGVACRVNFAGTGDERYVQELKQAVQALGLSDRVRWMGMVTGDKKIATYRAAAVFALPTSQENFGLVYPEALACGTPVIATKGVDIWPELEKSGGATIADATPSAFADAIGQMITDRARAQAMGEAGRAWVHEALDGNRTAREFERLYEQAIDAGRTQSSPRPGT